MPVGGREGRGSDGRPGGDGSRGVGGGDRGNRGGNTSAGGPRGAGTESQGFASPQGARPTGGTGRPVGITWSDGTTTTIPSSGLGLTRTTSPAPAQTGPPTLKPGDQMITIGDDGQLMLSDHMGRTVVMGGATDRFNQMMEKFFSVLGPFAPGLGTVMDAATSDDGSTRLGRFYEGIADRFGVSLGPPRTSPGEGKGQDPTQEKPATEPTTPPTPVDGDGPGTNISTSYTPLANQRMDELMAVIEANRARRL